MPQAHSADRILAKFLPIFMMTAASVDFRRSTNFSSSSVPGNMVSMSSPQVIGSPAADQQPAIPVTPGTISVGNRSFKRM